MSRSSEVRAVDGILGTKNCECEVGVQLSIYYRSSGQEFSPD